MTLYTMLDAYESANFARRKPMTARAKQAISRALKGKRRGGMSMGKKVAIGAGAVAGLAALNRYGGAAADNVEGIGNAAKSMGGKLSMRNHLSNAASGAGRQLSHDVAQVGRKAGRAGRAAIRGAKNAASRIRR